MARTDRYRSTIEYRLPKTGPVRIQVMWNSDLYTWKAWVDQNEPIAEGRTRLMRTGIIRAHLALRKCNKKRLTGPAPVEL